MPDESILRAKAPEAVRARKLLSQRPDRTWGGRGVLPMELQVGDRFMDETAEWEVTGRPFTTAAGKNAHARVQKVSQPEFTDLLSWGAHERIRVKRATAEEGKR
jgi:hypothetical protein